MLSGAMILIVDDSEINREVAQHILQGQGASCVTCSTGAEALEHLQGSPISFDIVLMDVQMPQMDGNEATKRIRGELHLTLPIIALTAGALVSERERSLKAGMNDFLTKPFEPAALIGIVRRYLVRQPTASLSIAPVKPADGPSLPLSVSSQINSTVAREMFGENSVLWASLLARLVRDFSEFALPISATLHDVAALTHLKARLHKLAGSAGMIGATTVHRLAGAVEVALAAEQAPDVVESLLRQLAAAFAALGEEVAAMLAATATSNPTVTGE